MRHPAFSSSPCIARFDFGDGIPLRIDSRFFRSLILKRSNPVVRPMTMMTNFFSNSNERNRLKPQHIGAHQFRCEQRCKLSNSTAFPGLLWRQLVAGLKTPARDIGLARMANIVDRLSRRPAPVNPYELRLLMEMPGSRATYAIAAR